MEHSGDPQIADGVLDVQLMHNLMHDRYVPSMFLTVETFNIVCSVVCSVRFSPDGQYLATGCNRTAQIYDTKTGAKTW
jgi:glucose repression regulatory protein TUP1